MVKSIQPLSYFNFYYGKRVNGVVIRDDFNEIVLTKAEVMEILEMINDSEQNTRKD